MNQLPDIAHVAGVIRAALEADFDKVAIVDVRILDRYVTDDEVTLEVQVIFEGKPKDLDAKKVASAVRHVRPKLDAIGERGFPLFSFVSKGDAGNFAPA